MSACKHGHSRLASLLPFWGIASQQAGKINRGNQRDKFMAVRIHIKHIGCKNNPVYRIVVADSRSPRDGKFLEEIGTYQPRLKSDKVKLNLDRTKYWLGKGAQPSDTVASFIKKAEKAAA
jgi:small subunit ribosomal protein S16